MSLKNLINIITYYFTFSLATFLLKSAMVSVVTFFHFQLKHELQIAEYWIFNHSWEILSIAKLLSFIFIFKFFADSRYLNFNFKNFVISNSAFPSRKILISFIFLMVFSVYLNPNLSQHSSGFDLFSYGVHGYIFYFIFDFLLLYILFDQFKIVSNLQRVILHCTLTSIFIITNYTLIPYLGLNGIVFLFHFITLLLIINSQEKSFLDGIFYTFGIVSFFAIYFRLNPFVQNEQLEIIHKKISFSSLWFLWIIVWSYFIISKKISRGYQNERIKSC